MNIRTIFAQSCLVATVATIIISPPAGALAKAGCTLPALPSVLASQSSATIGKTHVTNYAGCINRSINSLQAQEGPMATGAINARLASCRSEILKWNRLAQPRYPRSTIPVGSLC